MTNMLSLRINKQLKEDFYSFCKRKGFTAGKAVTLLAKQFSKSGEIPFSLDVDGNRRYSDGNFIRVSIFLEAATREQFAAACEEYGLPMSIVVRSYMDYCVTNDSFPYGGDKKRRGCE